MAIDLQEVMPNTRRAAAPASPPKATPTPVNQRRTGGHRWRRRVLLGLGVLAVVITGGVLWTRTVAPGSDVPMLTHTIQRGDLVVSVVEQGTLESSSNREIKCKVKGGSTVLWVVEAGTEVEPGDELIRLDMSTIEDTISQQRITYETVLANKKISESEVAVAQINITEYLEGTYRSELATKEKEVVVAQSNLKAAENMRDYTQRVFRKGYVSQLEVESQEDAVKHAELELSVKQTELEVLEKFGKAKKLQELEGLLQAAEAKLSADTASLELEEGRLRRAEEQLQNCTVVAEAAGLVIYPSAAEWREEPDIEEGATVREDQVMLIMPDLRQMQVKVGIHESKVDRVKPGMQAEVQLQGRKCAGTVSSIATVTKPSGWWTGNLVKYDTIIALDEQTGLKPGMSVSVEVFLARHEDVITVPVAAVMEEGSRFWCWVATPGGPVRRELQLGDTNDQFIIVESGLQEGEQVVLNPLDFLDEAQRNALQPKQDDSAEEEEEKELIEEPATDAEPAASEGEGESALL